ncbi:MULTISPECIES: HNH endonuclease [unclassified Methylococcus]|uniref:HNH endonuclease n=1 Tax=unclassified Methylococcus TaxID=2618889 RepID=UPI003D7D75B9
MSSKRWNKEQLKLAFNLYCQIPFGKLHSRNSEIIELARLIGRTPSAVAMKLVNFASLDPAITASGRKGLGNASALDREVWDEFHADWEKLALECATLDQQLRSASTIELATDSLDSFDLNDYSGETRRAIVEQRVKQLFFRRAVLASYGGRCCMSGLSDARLLVASHIVPWSRDKVNRLNPSNGLCLSVLHDKAFDRGLITVSDEFRVMVSSQLRDSPDGSMLKSILVALRDQPIEKPERFLPRADFLARHRAEVYVG